MQVKSITSSELISLRNWILEVYNSGKAYTKVTKEQLFEMLEKLKEIDKELLDRVFSVNSVDKLVDPIRFVDDNFEATLKSIREVE